MRTIEVQLFKYEELSERAQERARDWWRKCVEGDTFWSENTIDEAVEQGKLMGIDFKTRDVPLHGGGTRQEPCIFWSGFCCQGDGACFEGTWRAKDVKADKVADGWGDDPATTEIKRIAGVFADIAKRYPFAYFHVTHSGIYSHSNSTEFEVDLDGVEGGESSITQEQWDEECAALKENARDFMDWIYRQLEKGYGWHNSDESVAENITANDYEFTEDGEIA